MYFKNIFTIFFPDEKGSKQFTDSEIFKQIKRRKD